MLLFTVQKSHVSTAVGWRKIFNSYDSLEEGPLIYKKIWSEGNLEHANDVIWHEENRETALEVSYRCRIMRKVIRNELTTRGRFHSFFGLSADRPKDTLR